MLRRQRKRHCATVRTSPRGFGLPVCDHPGLSVLVSCCLARFNQRRPTLPKDDREHRERTKRISPPPAEYCVRAHNSVITAPTLPSSIPAAFAAGGVGVLGGLIGPRRAEFRLPLLIGVFGFLALQAVIMNKAMSLVVVLTALPARLAAVPIDTLADYWFVVVNLLAGSLIGAWIGATWATRMRSATIYRVLAALLALIAAVLAWSHIGHLDPLTIQPVPRAIIGVLAGIGTGVVAALMGVAGGELLIPTIVLLFAVDIKIAGSLSLAISGKLQRLSARLGRVPRSRQSE